MLHYDPLDQHNSAGVFRVFLAHLLHHLITSHVRNVKSVLLRAYLRSAASFQLYRWVQPSNRTKESVLIGYFHAVSSRLWTDEMVPLSRVLRDRSAQNSAAARSDWEQRAASGDAVIQRKKVCYYQIMLSLFRECYLGLDQYITVKWMNDHYYYRLLYTSNLFKVCLFTYEEFRYKSAVWNFVLKWAFFFVRLLEVQ